MGVATPAGIRSPMLWGSEERLLQLCAGGIRSLQTTRRQYVFRHHSLEHWLEIFHTYDGPITRIFAALTGDRDIPPGVHRSPVDCRSYRPRLGTATCHRRPTGQPDSAAYATTW